MPEVSEADGTRYRLIGGNGSPYSMKLRALMRYRRLPFDWIQRTIANEAEYANVRPRIIPILQLPDDGSCHVDTTPIAELLERRHPTYRSVIPDDPAHAYLSYLIEDMADEWLTKAMFYYRWIRQPDIDYAARWIADDVCPDATGAEREAFARMFAERQIGRMPLVGCIPQNGPIIEATYQRVLAALDPHVGQFQFLFGTRPSLADFGLFGQLKTLATDPTPMAIMRRDAQRTESWLRQLDDASGVEGTWDDPSAGLSSAVIGLLSLAGDTYLPFLAANHQAAEKGEGVLSLDLLGHNFSQDVFRYQVKCYAALRGRLQTLPADACSRLQALLEETGCWRWLAQG